MHDAVRETARSFVDNVNCPVAEALDREGRFPAAIYEEVGSLGLFGIAFPTNRAERVATR